jgi:hypothetical protein
MKRASFAQATALELQLALDHLRRSNRLTAQQQQQQVH